MRTSADCISLLHIPLELICHVLSILDCPSLMRCTETCKFLRKVIESSSQLQFIIDLNLYRMVGIPGPTSTTATCRKLLRERERRWNTLAWTGRHTLDLPTTGSVYEFVGGLYGNGREDDHRVAASISFVELPSTEKPETKRKKWVLQVDQEVSIVDFTMDPTQDLLVLAADAVEGSNVTYELHLRTLSTNEPHPLAPVAVLPSLARRLTTFTTEMWASVRVQIVGDLVALLVKEVLEGVGAHLQIWNWKTGPHRSCTVVIHDGVDDFSFLSANVFLLATPKGMLQVYRFDNPALARGACTATCTAQYALPPLSPGFIYWYISMSSNPTAGYVPSVTADPSISSARILQPFYPIADERVQSCCLYAFNPHDPNDHLVRSFVFFFDIRTLLYPPPRTSLRNHKSPPSSPHSDTTSIEAFIVPPPIPWKEWGPANTRWFSEYLSTDWQHALYGYRTVDVVRESSAGEGKKKRIRVRNFNPFVVRRSLGEAEGSANIGEPASDDNRNESIRRIVTAPSRISALGSFTEDIVSSLPYVEVVSEEKFDVSDVMMDECRILLLQRTTGGGVIKIDVLTM